MCPSVSYWCVVWVNLYVCVCMCVRVCPVVNVICVNICVCVCCSRFSVCGMCKRVFPSGVLVDCSPRVTVKTEQNGS